VAKVVKINYSKCNPEVCDAGKCPAAKECDSRALHQIEPFEKPNVDASICHGCFKCSKVCLLRAIEEING